MPSLGAVSSGQGWRRFAGGGLLGAERPGNKAHPVSINDKQTDKQMYDARMPKLLDLTGKRFNKLVAISFERDGKRTVWTCLCDCGATCLKESYSLRRSSRTASCGCHMPALVSEANSTHKMTKSRVYRSWSAMKRRCYAPSDPAFFRYGGRGITVCAAWLSSFEQFFSDMGDPPTIKHSLDRIDVNGNYEPSNCRWATPKQQALNTRRNVRHEFHGEPLTIREISRRTGVPEITIRKRLSAGHPIERAASNVNLRYGSVIQTLRP